MYSNIVIYSISWCSLLPSLQDAHDNEVSALCFSQEGNYMATGGADKVVKVWNWRPAQGVWGGDMKGKNRGKGDEEGRGREGGGRGG